jgi:hypothetical protein
MGLLSQPETATMAHDSGPSSPRPAGSSILHEIAWLEIFPVLNLGRAAGLAMRVQVLFLALAGLLLTIFGWWLAGWAFSGTDDPTLQQWLRTGYVGSPWRAPRLVPPPPGVALLPDFGTLTASPVIDHFPRSPYGDTWWQLAAPFRQVFSTQTTVTSLAFVLVCGLWAVAVWALFGGAIARIAAVQFALEEPLGWQKAIAFARKNWLAYFASPLLPLVGVLFLSVPIAMVGAMMRLDVGVLFAALVWPLLLVAGLLMGIFLLGLFFGWPLMWGAVSIESGDSFDALSRSYSYVYQRPLHYLGYALVASVLGVLAGTLVYYFAATVVYLVYWAILWGCGQQRLEVLLTDRSTLSLVARAGLKLIDFWNGCVNVLALSFVFSYFWTASTAIYLLLRLQVDGTELDEIYLEESPEAAAQANSAQANSDPSNGDKPNGQA